MRIFIKNMVKNIFFYLFLFCLIIQIILLYGYFKSNSIITTYYDSYNDVGYEVYLKDNDYFNKKTMEMDKQYIVKLIDFIKIKYKFKYSFSSKISYTYKTKIISKIIVKNTNTEKNLYELEEVNYENSETVKKKKNQVISRDVDIDFNKYNDLVKKFADEYNLKSSNSVLQIDVVVDIVGVKNTISQNFKDSMKIKYTLPLNEETIDIRTEYISNNNDVSYFIYGKSNNNSGLFVILIIVDLIVMLIALYKLFGNYIKLLFVVDTNKNEESYKIMRKYGDFIHEVSAFNFNLYKEKIKVLSFEPLLDIKDTINNPIFMKKGKKVTYFFILQQSKIYIYSCKNICK